MFAFPLIISSCQLHELLIYLKFAHTVPSNIVGCLHKNIRTVKCPPTIITYRVCNNTLSEEMGNFVVFP